MATRSPGRTPKRSTSWWPRAATVRKCSLEGDPLVLVDEEVLVAVEGGQLEHGPQGRPAPSSRSGWGCPGSTTSSISKGPPGAVRVAVTSARVGTASAVGRRWCLLGPARPWLLLSIGGPRSDRAGRWPRGWGRGRRWTGSRPARPATPGCRPGPGGRRPSAGRRPAASGYQRPASSLIGRDVDRAVVEVLLDLGEVGGQEPAVGADRVPGQRHGAGLGHVGPDELERLPAGLLQGELRGDRSRRAGRSRCACPGRSRPWPPAPRRWRGPPGRGPRPPRPGRRR